MGAILGLEVSRLARSSADLQRLLELCRLTDTLVIDADGIYDLQDFNDRLLLGLKGTMSEAELHLLAGRLQGAKRAAAERGELRFPLPVGYVYDDDGQTVIDPDEQVRAAVADLFAAFEQTGSAYGVVGVFQDQGRRFPRRAYGGAWAGELRWGRLTHSRVLGVLQNPAYAGAYVYGRYRSRRLVSPDGTIHTRTVELPRSEWVVVIHAHHPGYIDWETFLRTEARLQRNRTNAGERPPRGRGAAAGDPGLRRLRAPDVDPLPGRAWLLRVLEVARRSQLTVRWRGGALSTALLARDVDRDVLDQAPDELLAVAVGGVGADQTRPRSAPS